jgi:hypothetical protein
MGWYAVRHVIKNEEIKRLAAQLERDRVALESGAPSRDLAHFQGGFPYIQGLLPLRRDPVAPVGGSVTHVRRAVALIRSPLAHISDLLPLVRGLIPLVCSRRTVRLLLLGR